MAGFRFSFDEMVWLMNENMLTAYPPWLTTTLDKSKIPSITDSLTAKKLLIEYEDKYVISPVIEFLMSRMNRARVWLAVLKTYFIYIDIDVTVSLYNESDDRVTITPYETPDECFASVQAAIGGGSGYAFVVDESSTDNKAFADKVRLIWESLYEQRKNCD